MQIRKLYENSYTAKIVNLLLDDNLKIDFKNTLIGKVLSKIYVPFFAEITLFLSIIIFWYEKILVQISPFFVKPLLIPLLLILSFMAVDKKAFVIRKYHLYYLSFILTSIISALFAVKTIEKEILFSGIYLFSQFGLVLFISENLKNKATMIKNLVWTALPISFMAFFQIYSKVDTRLWFSSFEEGTTRAFAFFGSPNVLGLVAAILSLLSFGIYFNEKKKLYLIPCGLFFLTLILTFSREAYLAFFVAILVVTFFTLKKAFYATLVSVPLFSLIVPQIRERFSAAFSADYFLDSYLDGRIWSVINGYFLFKKKPILGWGPGSYGGETALRNASPVYLEGIQNGYTALYFTDNQLIEIMVQLGFIGIFMYFFFALSLINSYLKSFLETRNNLVLTGIAVFILFLTGGLFANVLEFGAVSTLTAFVLGAMHEQ